MSRSALPSASAVERNFTMKTLIQSWRNKQLKLVIDEPRVAPDKRAVLAVAELHEGLSVWTITDVRLAQYRTASPYFNVGADHFWASWTAKDADQLQRVRGHLRETFPQKPGGELGLDWCTFDGIVRGKTPAEMGVAAHLNNPAAVLHKLQDVRAYLDELQEFWGNWPHSERDPDIREKASALKIHNPWRQPSSMAISIKAELHGNPAENKELNEVAMESVGNAVETVKSTRDCAIEYLLREYESYAKNVAEGDPMSMDDWVAGSDIPGIVRARTVANGGSCMGEVWWIAGSLPEAQRWEAELTAKGAKVEIKPEEDRPAVHVIITLDCARANEILGYEVGDDEWLEEGGQRADAAVEPKTYEVAAKGFDRASDATDDRVFWVRAEESLSDRPRGG